MRVPKPSVLKHLFSVLSIVPIIVFAHESDEPADLPWLTGPLIAPPGTVTPQGQYSIQPFVSFIANTGFYNTHWRPVSAPNFYNVTLDVQVLVGITPWMDFQTTPQALYNNTQGHSSTRFGDLPLGFDFQLFSSEQSRWFPGIKLQLIETFPTGHYQKLNPHKLRTDASSLGSFYTSFDLIFYKIYSLWDRHYLSMTADFSYTIFSLFM